MRRGYRLAFVAAFAALPLGSAMAQVGESGHSLPLSLALKASTTAIASCGAQGYAVSAAIVDTSGVIRLELKGDRSTIHTTATAYRKAYTVVTFGPIFRFDTSSADVAALPGAAAIKVRDEIVAALGVSGSPGGDKDEACAQAGIASIKDDLASSR